MDTFRLKLLQTQLEMMKLYLDESDRRPWYVAYSGGKDSTCVLKLVTDMLTVLPPEKRWREIVAGMSDTIVENPELHLYMREQARLVNEWAEKNNMPLKTVVTFRETKQSYFVLTLGKGYRLPDNTGRWCTDRLKIEPQKKLKDVINPSYTLSGVRITESSSRKQSIEKYTIDAELDRKIAYDGDVSKDIRKLYMPIIDFTVEDVWRALTLGVVWGSTIPVRRIYKEATGECGFSNPSGVEKKAVEVCGARFGCWLCPVISSDKSTERMAFLHKWMQPLTEWRELHIRIYGQYEPTGIKVERMPKKPTKRGNPNYEEEMSAYELAAAKVRETRDRRSEELRHWERENRRMRMLTKSGYDRRGSRMEEWEGTLSIEARRFLLDRLLETQKRVNELREADRLDPIELISMEEIALIEQQHEEDQRIRPYLSKPLDIEKLAL